MSEYAKMISVGSLNVKIQLKEFSETSTQLQQVCCTYKTDDWPFGTMGSVDAVADKEVDIFLSTLDVKNFELVFSFRLDNIRCLVYSNADRYESDWSVMGVMGHGAMRSRNIKQSLLEKDWLTSRVVDLMAWWNGAEMCADAQLLAETGYTIDRVLEEFGGEVHTVEACTECGKYIIPDSFGDVDKCVCVEAK
ncbi:hypothetical protein [Psychromonas sp. Urea-02u-13]|uniref:hypothetical protein n=1 Tax=Psychromonas sp. Urea-02u-13 TaxID=2058326 RepID=UPI000C321C29|nr:hypothetical protein [Psychromonas sp. Urea-02u-13]PKG40208.1 hypothetical protein CXF74_03815 [Psychromonas sp. Urea-02u-13]